MAPMTDPVLVRRARYARAAAVGTRVGFLLLLAATVAFATGWVTGFGGAVTAVVVVSILGTTVTLAPAIVVGHAVHAAEREDRERE